MSSIFSEIAANPPPGLRLFEPADAEDLAEAVASSSLEKMKAIPSPYLLEDARDFIARSL